MKRIIIICTTIIILVIFLFLTKNKSKDIIDIENNIVIENSSSIENVEINNKEIVQVKFSWEVNGINYTDALNIPKDQYIKLNEEDIQKMKEKRFKNWVKNINSQSKVETS